MRSRSAAIGGNIVGVVALPGTVAGLIPWWISRWQLPGAEPLWIPAQVVGAVLIAAGLYVLLSAVARFALALGTLAPVAPTERLVVEGFHRFVRNPMYVGVIAAILGQALLFGSLGVAVYGIVVWVFFSLFVRWYEEPTLVRQFGGEYETYRRNVPAWIPRVRPWEPAAQPDG
ncbi:protein-S-isoprenylcysteine O-methyltransferase Ste14 [Lipingzhangella halophila]|uniref:Protein-S-isoprenylcysteine O-methyltransferase Ste14 n=1 Tax=Lipingzhangella halophila TaxID=1783352 RepID=A0A7W7W3B7_9ACTN|nr:isoprenylcysteine carboxylmethyltransferase family protein [Lipingzhangella halophila]MBB4932611.1 protein-S-isoprenylcysteine O-methyltransferase Ste14 [Lipingzhangella halophila]